VKVESKDAGNGSIRVCKTVVNQDEEITDGSSQNGSFTVDVFEDKNKQNKIKTVEFETPLHYTRDTLTSNDDKKDVVCETVDELDNESDYYYSRESVAGSGWKTPQYNDQMHTEAETIDDFFDYSGELYDDNPNNDNQRNQDADGHIVLTPDRPNRTLIVKNTMKQSGNGGFACEDLDGKNGWYGEYFNYMESHPDMELPQSEWDTDNGDPLSSGGTWEGDWYQDQYFKFARVDNTLTFGGNFFPFGSDDYHFGAHWQADVEVDTAGDYPYTLTSDDDAWVYVDGELRVDNSGVHPPQTKNGSLTLSEGTHKVAVFFAERHTVKSHLTFKFTDKKEKVTTKPHAPQCEQAEENTPPTARDDMATTTDNTPIDINVLANDNDQDGDPLTITNLTQPSAGSVATTTNDNIRYTPDAGFVGTTTFTYTIADGNGGSDTATVTVNDTAGDSKETLTLVANKVVCDDESQLPNWDRSGKTIDKNTAQQWVDTHDGCELASGWEFQWNDEGTPNPGDNQGTVNSWNTFGPTDGSGTATTTLRKSDIASSSKIWVREGFKNGFVEFTGEGSDDDSAEMWCHTDVVNYDNYDYIGDPQTEQTYYCTAFNAQKDEDGGGGGDDTPECSDGVDNDGDGVADADDPGCHTDRDPNDDDDSYNPDDDSEQQSPQCSDDVDNDGDMDADEQDDGCHTDGDATDGDNTYDPDDKSENQKPVISIIGDNPYELRKGTTYNDPGATASDPEDGDITDDIATSSDVDTSSTGTYTVRYNVTDSDGADADEKTRTVEVIQQRDSDDDSDSSGSSGSGSGGGGGFDLKITNEAVEEGDTEETAEVTWDTNTDATSRVVYGTTSITEAELDDDEDNYRYPDSTDEDEDEVESHSMQIDDLDPTKTYYFRPVSDTSFTGEEIGDEVRLSFGEVAGAQTAATQDAPATCSPYLKDFLKQGWNNDRLEVLKLQTFLKTLENFDSVQLTGEFDQRTLNAVEAFQMRYSDDVLAPWGYAADDPTGFVYITTKTKINEIVCNTEIPFTAAELQEMEEFKERDQYFGRGGSAGVINESGQQSLNTSDDSNTEDDGRISAAPATTSAATAATSSATTSTQEDIANSDSDAVRSPMASVAAGVYTALDAPIDTIRGAFSGDCNCWFVTLLALLIGGLLVYIFMARPASQEE